MTIQERLDAIAVGDNLTIDFGWELFELKQCVVRHVFADKSVLISVDDGLVHGHTLVSVKDDPVPGAAALNPLADEDNEELLAALQIYHGKLINSEHDGGLFTILAINGNQTYHWAGGK